MEQPRISVIVPVYKVEKWVQKCVKSICAQDYENLEIICVDDGSPDNSGKLLDELAAGDPRIRVIHQQNRGLSAARNAALEVATGEWVTGVDGDDWLLPHTYSALLPSLTSSVDLVVYGTQMVDEAEHNIPQEKGDYFDLPEKGVYQVQPGLMGSVNVCFWNKLWRLNLIQREKIRFPEGLLHEDEAFSRLYYPLCKTVAFIPSVAYQYVQRCGSIMEERRRSGAEIRAHNYLAVAEWLHREYVQRGYGGSTWVYFMSLLWISVLANGASDRARRKQMAAYVAQYISPDEDYRLRYCLREKPLCSWWYRYAPDSVKFGLPGVTVLHLCYDGKTGRCCGWETFWGKLRRRLKCLLNR